MRKAFLVAIAAATCLGVSAPRARADALRADAFRAHPERAGWWSTGVDYDRAVHSQRAISAAAIPVRWDEGQWEDAWSNIAQHRRGHLSFLIESALNYLRLHDGATFSDWHHGDMWNGPGSSGVGDPVAVDPPADPPAATPEPASLLLLGTGALGLIRRRRRAPAR
jgi:hypothetical protein